MVLSIACDFAHGKWAGACVEALCPRPRKQRLRLVVARMQLHCDIFCSARHDLGNKPQGRHGLEVLLPLLLPSLRFGSILAHALSRGDKRLLAQHHASRDMQSLIGEGARLGLNKESGCLRWCLRWLGLCQRPAVDLLRNYVVL